MMAVMATVPHLRDPFIRRTGSGFEVWADEYVPNQPGAASTAKALRSLITDEVRALPGPGGRLLHAGYGGWRWHGTDVENLLFNNIDQGLSLFRKPAKAGVRFEDWGLMVPPAPDGTSWKSFYSYRLAPAGASFAAVRQGPLVCRVSGAVVPDGPVRLAAARVWLAVRRLAAARSRHADGDRQFPAAGDRAPVGAGKAHQGSRGRRDRGHAARRTRPGHRGGSPPGEAAGCRRWRATEARDRGRRSPGSAVAVAPGVTGKPVHPQRPRPGPRHPR